MIKSQMPEEWSDSAGWERYYAGLYPHGDYKSHANEIGSIGLENFTQSNNDSNLLPLSVWIPGCGLSSLPKVLSKMGYIVHATDISSTAIAFQQSTDNDVSMMLTDDMLHNDGELICQVHDFRTPYIDGIFDLILNVKAFQKFSFEMMQQIAAIHYQALKQEGGQVIFDTMNVQGERMYIIEKSIIEAGFFLPFYELNNWYREQLDATDIPYVFILGQPMPPYREEFNSHPELQKLERNHLLKIYSEYNKRQEDEFENEQQRAKDATHFAQIIYSTG